MKAMILAAGKGNRMRPLTDHLPKPLLKVGKDPLIVHHIKNLARANIFNIVINLGHQGEKLAETLGNGHQYGVTIQYSYEDPILETGGGIAKALTLLGDQPFIALSGDIYTDFPFITLPSEPQGLAHLVLVDNPPHHPKGDYALLEGHVAKTGGPLLNFGGIGVYRPELFLDCPKSPFPLPRLFDEPFKKREITGEHYRGLWYNIGTPEQLQEINEIIA